MLPMGFIHDGVALNCFPMITWMGTPLTIAARELRSACLFPADKETEARHSALLAVAGE
jgi:hypothetical protein